MWSVSYLIYYSNSSFWCLNVELLSLLWIAGPRAVIPYSIWKCINEKYKICSVDFGRKFFTLFIANKLLEILLFICWMWCFQVKCSSMCIPRNCIYFFLPVLLIWAISYSFIIRFWFVWSYFLCLGHIMRYCKWELPLE